MVIGSTLNVNENRYRKQRLCAQTRIKNCFTHFAPLQVYLHARMKVTRVDLSPEKLDRGVWPTSQNAYPLVFMTKICDFPDPIYDLSKNLIPIYDLTFKSTPCFRPALKLVP